MKHVLVVEDDPHNAMLFRKVLEKRAGLRVTLCEDGAEILRLARSGDVDLVVLDVSLANTALEGRPVDGVELCQSVKTGLRESAPYFILLTAKGELSDRLLGLETGADDYLVKPCDQAELLARVRAGLRIVLLTRDLRDTVTRLRETQ